ncbi:hypothetical protein PRIC2_003704 [Phytophthora ramorum]
MGKLTRVYFDVSIGGSRAGRVEFQLFPGLPKTTENFRSLCTGERGLGRTTGKALHYKTVPFHRVIKGFMLQGGDLSNHDGTGGESIYGGKFEDESFRYRHAKAGLLSMANAGKNTNGSQFFITTVPTPHLDGKHVVFGEVVRGIDVMKKMESVETVAKDKPAAMQSVVIEDCGELVESDSDSEGKEKKKKRKKQEKKKKKMAKKEKKRAKKEAKREKRRREDSEDDGRKKRKHGNRGRSESREREETVKYHDEQKGLGEGPRVLHAVIFVAEVTIAILAEGEVHRVSVASVTVVQEVEVTHEIAPMQVAMNVTEVMIFCHDAGVARRRSGPRP